jgi:F0F1-type ATP synthase assembly protein I
MPFHLAAFGKDVPMPSGTPDPRRELGFYFSLSQVGLEMVVPVGVGIALDHYLHWRPWGTIAGAALGLVVGLVHLVVILNRHDQDGTGPSERREAP